MRIVSQIFLAAAFSGAFFLNPVSAQKASPKPDCVDCGSGCTSPDCADKCAEGEKALSQKGAKIKAASAKVPTRAMLLPISIKGMTCNSCVSKVTKALKDAGAKDVKVFLKSGLASVVPGKDAKPSALVQAVSKAGFKAQRVPVTVFALSVKGMTCESCASKVEKALKAFPAAYKVKVDVKKGRAIVVGPKGFLKPESLAKAVSATKFAATPLPTTMHCLDLKALGNTRGIGKQLKSIDGVLTAKIFSKAAHACVLTLDNDATTAAFEKTFGKAVRPACSAKTAKASKSACDDCASGKSECLDCDEGSSKAKGSCEAKKGKSSCSSKTKLEK
jgi:copper chaperone CopZ